MMRIPVTTAVKCASFFLLNAGCSKLDVKEDFNSRLTGSWDGGCTIVIERPLQESNTAFTHYSKRSIRIQKNDSYTFEEVWFTSSKCQGNPIAVNKRSGTFSNLKEPVQPEDDSTAANAPLEPPTFKVWTSDSKIDIYSWTFTDIKFGKDESTPLTWLQFNKFCVTSAPSELLKNEEVAVEWEENVLQDLKGQRCRGIPIGTPEQPQKMALALKDDNQNQVLFLGESTDREQYPQSVATEIPYKKVSQL